jgi:O-acetyl-ADP-ribose deacetylase (regulator of RNase III)
VWRGGGAGEAELLAACYRNSLALAAAHGVGSLAFPAISCGVYGYPAAEACAIAVAEVRAGLARHAGIGQVTLVAFDAAIEAHYARWLGLAVEDQQGRDDE